MTAQRAQPTFYEFFAGGGMARAALSATGWKCLFANDFDARKVAAYTENWGAEEVLHGDVRKIKAGDLPGRADLIWASFPCQDLSLAGGGAGLRGNRSGTFWPFWDLVGSLAKAGRAPTTVALENVCGTLTSHGGKDFEEICRALISKGYSVGAVVMDAAHFVPHSRPRLFVVGTLQSRELLANCVSDGPTLPWHTKALVSAYDRLPPELKKSWLWWRMPTPATRKASFADLVEPSPNERGWHEPEETKKLLAMMSPTNRSKIELAKKSGRLVVGTVYRRTRQEEGGRVQRAEVRFDDVAGCLRTPAGGSSRQILIFVEGETIRTRLISARETARLMGLPDSYSLPARYNEAYHLTGDGVAVPVVEYLSMHVLSKTISLVPESLVA